MPKKDKELFIETKESVFDIIHKYLEKTNMVRSFHISYGMLLGTNPLDQTGSLLADMCKSCFFAGVMTAKERPELIKKYGYLSDKELEEYEKQERGKNQSHKSKVRRDYIG